MTSPFERANDRLFARLGTPAEFRAGGDDPAAPVRIITRQPDIMLEVEATMLRRASTVVEVPVNLCARLREGDTFTVPPPSGVGLTSVYIVEGEPRRDLERLIWICGCRETQL